jgi:hypothetical protein
MVEDTRSDREREPGDDDRGAGTGVTGREAVATGRARQRDEFGGINWGAGFFGWLVAIGLAVILTAIVSAAGAAIGLSKKDAATISVVGGAALIAIFLIAYFAGGYVAGRMSRFDGARQGFSAWLWGLIVTLLAAAAGAIAGQQYNVFNKLQLPRVPIKEGDLTTGGIITLAAILIGSLLAAILGGKAGERYHRKVDRVGAAADPTY